MKEMEQLKAKWGELCQKADAAKDQVRPYYHKAREYCRIAKEYWLKAWPWIWRFRKVLFAVPVVWLAWYFARLNWNVLPEQVGFNLQSSGEYALYISKSAAVWCPLGVTAGCLGMMFLSKRTLYPWLICMFSILLPALILVTNIFPA